MHFSDASISMTSRIHQSSSRSSGRSEIPIVPPPAGNEEHLVSALHAAFHDQNRDFREKQHTGLGILVTNDQLVLRGMGIDVEPAVLTGNVVLHLTEPTAIKQILLVFKGKARVPSNVADQHALSGSSHQYSVCSHEWAFLEGENKHSRMLSAGRHLFPFELRLGGSLPSSLATYANGGASISYKLRATAIRPGLAANLHAMCPITLLRTFAPGSLEYQQTLEIENTWPEKIMYSLMIPYKAWAAGDEITAVVKFSPLAKGVRVVSITSAISETTKMLTRSGHYEKTRNVVTRKSAIVDGRAVPWDNLRRRSIPAEQTEAGNSNMSTDSPPVSFPSSSDPSVSFNMHESAPFATRTNTDQGFDLHPEEETEFTTTINVPLPSGLTPSHTLDPIIVSYRIRWSVFLTNLDGHASELRCSLPIHVLDFSLLEEARSATIPTRRLLLNDGDASNDPLEDEVQLPSYPSHVRDVGVGFETATQLPADLAHILPGVNGTGGSDLMPSVDGIDDASGSVANRSLYANASSRDPFVSSSNPPSRPPEPASEHDSPVDSSGPSRPPSRPGRESSGSWFGLGRSSRGFTIGSRPTSRANSRAASPERGESIHAQNATSRNASSSSDVVTFVHHTNAAARQPHGLFSATLKPISGLSAAWSSHTYTNAHVHHPQRNSASATISWTALHTPTESPPEGNGLMHALSSTLTSAVPDYSTAAHSAASAVPPLDLLTALPTYEDSERDAHAQSQANNAERAACAGVSLTPAAPETTVLATGSIENSTTAQRSHSDTDLVSHFARGRGDLAARFGLRMKAIR